MTKQDERDILIYEIHEIMKKIHDLKDQKLALETKLAETFKS